MSEAERKEQEEAKKQEAENSTSSKKPSSIKQDTFNSSNDPTEARMRGGAVPKPQRDPEEKSLIEARSLGNHVKDAEKNVENGKKEEEDQKPQPRNKKIPVIFFDEAHKLPALIRTDE